MLMSGCRVHAEEGALAAQWDVVTRFQQFATLLAPTVTHTEGHLPRLAPDHNPPSRTTARRMARHSGCLAAIGLRAERLESSPVAERAEPRPRPRESLDRSRLAGWHLSLVCRRVPGHDGRVPGLDNRRRGTAAGTVGRFAAHRKLTDRAESASRLAEVRKSFPLGFKEHDDAATTTLHTSRATAYARGLRLFTSASPADGKNKEGVGGGGN